MMPRARTGLSTVLKGLREPVVLVLGTTQTIGYGTLYYAYGVLAPSISREMGVSLEWFFAAFGLGLLFGGMFAPLAGRTLDRRGARVVMALGSLAAACALLFCALSVNIWMFVAGVILMEFAACLVLYEAAFAGLTQIFGHDARLRITAVSLIAGFASTIFWPLTQWLLVHLDWRMTFAAFAAAHLLVCAPLHLWKLARAVPVGSVEQANVLGRIEPPMHVGNDRQRALLAYAIAICVSGIVFSSFPVHMLRIIENEGFSPAAAALVAMIMGPAQVIARLVEIVGGQRFDALMTGRIALAALVLSILVLLGFSGSTLAAVLFAALYGVSQGLITIARGTVPLQLFGVRGYATLVGKVTGLRFVVNAIGPFAFAFLATHLGTGAAVAVNGIAALAALGAFLLLRRPAAT